MKKAINLKDKQFGLLTVIERVESKNGHAMWKCKCVCGNTVIARTTALVNGHKQLCEDCQSKLRKSSWVSDDRIYRTWMHMLQRCENVNDKAYKNYGMRGIKVCEEWHDFTNFQEWALTNGYSDSLTIDRIDCNGNYEPNNCRWVTQKIQQNNRTNNCNLTLFGVTKTKKQWSEITGVKYTTISKRLALGWSVERALTEPVKDMRFGSSDRVC